MMRAAIFLDRDGVLNPTVFNPATGRMESPLTARDFHLCEGVIPALHHLQEAGYPLILVSNQPNYALGKCSYDTHRVIRHQLEMQLEAAGIRFTRSCYCLHHPKGITPGYSGPCECRKPSPWFLLQARDDLALNLRDSWMIGDQPTDTECGRAAGVRTIRVFSGELRVGSGLGPTVDTVDPCADYFALNLTEAVGIIFGSQSH